MAHVGYNFTGQQLIFGTTLSQPSNQHRTSPSMTRNKGRKHLTTEQKAKVVGMKASGLTVSQVSRLAELPRSTVDSILMRNRERGTVETTKRPGRPRKTTDRDLRELKDVLESNRKTKLSEVGDLIQTQVCDRTLRKRIRDLGYNSCVAVKKPYVNDKQKKNRLRFAREHSSWTVADWERVIWSDESSFEIGKNSELVRVWRTKQQKYNLECLEPTFKSGRSSTMVWGAFFGITKTPLVFIPPGQRKAANFIRNVYMPGLVPFLKDKDPDCSRRLLLMEDGAPVHTAKLSAKFRAEAKIDKIPKWPSQSPDLNPIENVWKVLKTNVQNFYHPRSVDEMHEALRQAWDDFPSSTLIHIIDSMPGRMQAVFPFSQSLPQPGCLCTPKISCIQMH
ncbi:hypothetical protein MJO28_005542 [Puccinia striiformis f. sp. tritici]|uniref:Uncharacterized protein n=1 Tax=Puccinia striiformis f. sp. tritici TaxID=168172 RepID=A0ACC0EKB7_9BASI|nr:hypothetical protein MJO28_005542 [Puccinia striiformis f. sp. tritici]